MIILVFLIKDGYSERDTQRKEVPPDFYYNSKSYFEYPGSSQMSVFGWIKFVVLTL